MLTVSPAPDILIEKNTSTRTHRAPLAFAVFALALYVPGFWWGIPHATAPDRTHAWGTDDETPLGPQGLWWGFVAGLASVAVFLLIRVRALFRRGVTRVHVEAPLALH